MSKVRIAVIGCGSIANGLHMPAYEANKDCEIVYTVDLIEERAKTAKEKYKAKEYLTNYKDLLSRDDYDAVSVCVPNSFHDVIAIDFLKAGKDVLSEKPIANNYERALKMQEVANSTNQILNIGVCVRFDKNTNRVKKIIESGLIGDVYHIFCSLRAYRSIPGLGGPFTNKELSGGGVLIDWGVHVLDLMLYTAGIKEIKTVSADAYNILGKDTKGYLYKSMWGLSDIENGTKTVEEFVSGQIRTDSAGITFVTAWAQNIESEEKYIDFLGDKGGIRLDYCGSYKLFNRIGDELYTSVPFIENNNMGQAEIDDFIRAIKERDYNARNNINNVINVAKLMENIYISAEKKEEVKLY